MGKLDKRIDDLQKKLKPEGEPIFAVDWGDGFLTVEGGRITREEFEARYPEREAYIFKVVYEDL